MESRRALNPAMPTALVWGQLALYLSTTYAVGHGLAQLRFPGWEILIGCWALLGAYGVANERRWGWRVAVAAAVVSVLPAVDQFVRSPGIGIHPDFLVLVVLPVFTVCCLAEPSARDFQRAWFR
jgi:hypothetical protein